MKTKFSCSHNVKHIWDVVYTVRKKLQSEFNALLDLDFYAMRVYSIFAAFCVTFRKHAKSIVTHHYNANLLIWLQYFYSIICKLMRTIFKHIKCTGKNFDVL